MHVFGRVGTLIHIGFLAGKNYITMIAVLLNGVARLRYVFALGIISIERAQQTLISRHDRFVKINTCSTSFYLHELPVGPMIGRGNSFNHLEEVTSE